MLAVKVELKEAEKVKQLLMRHNLLNKDCLVKKEEGFIYFPLVKKDKNLEKKLGLTVVNTRLAKKEKPKTLPQLLKGKLSSAELKLIPRTLEQIGSILILEIPEELELKEKVIAQAFLETKKNVRTVVKKHLAHSGEYRLRKVKIIAGEKTKEAVYQENGIRLKIDLEKAYFSARLANERLRIAKQIKKGEDVLVMFSGAAPYPLVLAKNSPLKSVYGIEINPSAHQLALENVELNKLENRIKLFQGDVRVILPKINKKFDRILMPLPKTGELFLGEALNKARKGTILHLYAFLEEKKIKEEAEKIRKICQNYKHPVKILRTIKCGQFSPYVFRLCFDLKVLV